MMNYREYAYPLWFNEGFAELASTIEIDPKSQTFKLGEVSKRAEVDGNLVMDWNELLSDDFDLHSIRSARMQSTAYTQSWLLTHYLILGEKGKNSEKLQKYFNLMFAGESSIDAFESSFGMSPDDIWEKALKDYVRNFQIYTVKFRPVDLDLSFQKAPTDPEIYESMIGYYESFARADGKPRLLRDPLNRLGGRWDFLAFDSSCTNPFQIFIDNQTGHMDWSFIGNERGMSPISFKFSLENETSLALKPIESTGDDMNFTAMDNAMNLQMPASDLVCLKTAGQKVGGCRLIMEKCD
jgi:hypothetical protein